jgi:LAO/AO transport system kinase
LGDEIQALKAGIMEIGDIFVVNKADKESADQTAQEIHSMIIMADSANGWRPRVVKTVATTGDGIDALAEAINQHLQASRRKETSIMQRDGLRTQILDAAAMYFDEVTLQDLSSSKKFEMLLNQVESQKIDPFTAGRRLIRMKH